MGVGMTTHIYDTRHRGHRVRIAAGPDGERGYRFFVEDLDVKDEAQSAFFYTAELRRARRLDQLLAVLQRVGLSLPASMRAALSAPQPSADPDAVIEHFDDRQPVLLDAGERGGT